MQIGLTAPFLGSIIARLDALTARLDRHLGSADDQP
jgi:hypothetical protein